MRRSLFKPSLADRRIWEATNREKDPSIATRWYFDWNPHPKQNQWLKALLWGGPQRQYLEMYATTGARFGKSEMVGGGLLLYSMRLTGKNPFVANISITLDQAKIVWDKAYDMATANRRMRHWFDPDNVKLTPFPTMRLHTGAEFWARSTMYECKYLRGYNFRAINYDEIAYGNQLGAVGTARQGLR